MLQIQILTTNPNLIYFSKHVLGVVMNASNKYNLQILRIAANVTNEKKVLPSPI